MSDVLEIWEKDPMSGAGCACSPVRISQVQAERIVAEMNERNETVKRLKAEFSDIKFERDIIHPQRSMLSYPIHVRELLDLGGNPPLFFMNKKVIAQGRFPSFLELKRVIVESLVGS